MTDDDIPITVDFRVPETARVWTEEADRKRPWRAQMRSAFAARVAGARAILELGSGPGQLAELLLHDRAIERCTLLDFAPPMHELARTRISDPRARFLVADFKQPGWSREVEAPYDAVVTMQAVHELRHKRHAEALYREALSTLRAGGVLLVCDHVPLDDAKTKVLNATLEEQHAALAAAGFTAVATELVVEGLYLCGAKR